MVKLVDGAYYVVEQTDCPECRQIVVLDQCCWQEDGNTVVHQRWSIIGSDESYPFDWFTPIRRVKLR